MTLFYLYSTTDILKLTLPLSRLKQSSSSAMEGVKEIKEKQTNCAIEFHRIYLETNSLGTEIGFYIKISIG